MSIIIIIRDAIDHTPFIAGECHQNAILIIRRLTSLKATRTRRLLEEQTMNRMKAWPIKLCLHKAGHITDTLQSWKMSSGWHPDHRRLTLLKPTRAKRLLEEQIIKRMKAWLIALCLGKTGHITGAYCRLLSMK